MASKKVSDATYTQMQELASAWVFKRAIRDNVVFTSAQSIIDDNGTFKEIQKIWKTLGKCNFGELSQDAEWMESFYQQQKTLLRKIGQPNFTEFCRSKDYALPGSRTNSKTFMEWVSELVKNEFQISQKDNWNPADIWLIQNEMKWRKEIKKAFDNRNVERLQLLKRN